MRKLGSSRIDPHVAAWAEQLEPSGLHLSAITVLELEQGVLQIERRDSAQGLRLRRWLETQVLTEFEGRILPVDKSVALACAALHVPAPRSQRDALIAATARVHKMTLATRNLPDFQGTAWR
ncbi:type II toxin-antitoxin system VapC family toxin [Caulobacter sp. 73W]|uniref:Type II toxin-antitoxin system VapC family toxin n=1 Tax=Caulobacter sp. 73W TaxID=3161137 RepID=A0AB39KY76_9CAUL